MKLNGFWPAKLTSYDAATRTGEVWIDEVTDGADRGLVAEFAYPVGEDDQDTERKITLPANVYVFFEMGDPRCPVVFAWRTRQDGSAVVGTRRIRQQNIQVLATANLNLTAERAEMSFNSMLLTVPAGLNIVGPVTCQTIECDTVTASDDVIAAAVSLKKHPHNLNGLSSPTRPPTATENS